MKWPAAILVIVAAGLGVFVLLGRGHAKTGVVSSTTTTVPTMPVRVYFYRGAALVPVTVQAPKTKAVATAAVHALLAGPPSGYSTAIPEGTRLLKVEVPGGGVAAANFSQELAGAPRTAQAQIVYTLTEFATIKHVLVAAAGSPLQLTDGAGSPDVGGATRETYVDLTPDAPIFVETPLRGATVSSPVNVSGTASVFEATLALEVRRDGQLLETDSITASNGAPDRGTFEKSLDLQPGDYQLVFYEPSAQDGSHLHTTTVDVTVAP